jgi:hypothetical protein
VSFRLFFRSPGFVSVVTVIHASRRLWFIGEQDLRRIREVLVTYDPELSSTRGMSSSPTKSRMPLDTMRWLERHSNSTTVKKSTATAPKDAQLEVVWHDLSIG